MRIQFYAVLSASVLLRRLQSLHNHRIIHHDMFTICPNHSVNFTVQKGQQGHISADLHRILGQLSVPYPMPSISSTYSSNQRGDNFIVHFREAMIINSDHDAKRGFTSYTLVNDVGRELMPIRFNPSISTPACSRNSPTKLTHGRCYPRNLMYTPYPHFVPASCKMMSFLACSTFSFRCSSGIKSTCKRVIPVRMP